MAKNTMTESDIAAKYVNGKSIIVEYPLILILHAHIGQEQNCHYLAWHEDLCVVLERRVPI
jgi:hypothetical protein